MTAPDPAAPVVALQALPPPARLALARLAELATGPAWLVGGAVRSALEGLPTGDVDVAVPAGAIRLGRALANRISGAAFVVLDHARGACRVLSEVQLDIAELRGPSLDDDLRGRDFTVNALAVSVRELVAGGRAPVHDPTGGLGDLERRAVRLCAPDAIASDPVRAIRAARLAIRPQWSLDPTAAAAIADSAERVALVSAERVREELASVLADPVGARGLRLLDELGVFPVILPERRAMKETMQSEPHRFDVWEHSLRAVEAADAVLGDLGILGDQAPAVQTHLGQDLGDGLTRRHVLKLAALLHDVSKPETLEVVDGRTRFFGHDARGAERTESIAARWRLSGNATGVLRKLVAQHLRPMHLAIAGGVTRRARYRFVRDLGEDFFDLILLSLCDAAALRGDPPAEVWRGPSGAILRELMAGMEEETRAARVTPLVTGHDVMAELGLSPGPEVGRQLARAREAQALGLISTRSEALEYLRRRPDGS